MKPGDIFVVSNEENLSTGYSWGVDTRASTGLDRVAISDGGHTQPGESLPGAPGAHSWTIRALEPGRATIQFVYQRPWEPAPVRTRRVIVKISP
jgi:inhibitor of cysteine peptidase